MPAPKLQSVSIYQNYHTSVVLCDIICSMKCHLFALLILVTLDSFKHKKPLANMDFYVEKDFKSSATPDLRHQPTLTCNTQHLDMTTGNVPSRHSCGILCYSHDHIHLGNHVLHAQSSDSDSIPSPQCSRVRHGQACDSCNRLKVFIFILMII